MYIGSSISLHSRIKLHISKLRTNKHYSKHLQAAWNKYGENNFKFEIIRKVKNLKLLIRYEQVYINLYNSAVIGYNKRKIADSNIGNKWSDESRKKLSNSKLGIKSHINQINSVKGNKFNKGGYKLSKEFKEKRKQLSIDFWKNISPIKKKQIFEKIASKRRGIKNPKAFITIECRLKANLALMKPIDQFDINNNFIKNWKCCSEAVKELKIQASYLS